MRVESALPPLSAEDRAFEVEETNCVNRFNFTGNTVFSSQELSYLLRSYTNRPITRLELEEARVAVTKLYIAQGYVNSGAVLEDAALGDGVMRVKIVEGRLTTVNLHGNRWLSRGFYERRLRAHGGDPLNVNEIRDTLGVWREVYPVEQVNADIQPGALPGEAIMDVKVKERFPFHAGLQFGNNHPPSTGAEQIDLLLRAESLTGLGDQLAFDYGIARAAGNGMSDPYWLGADDLAATYSVPFTAYDTALGMEYIRSSSSVLEAPFAELNIRSETESYGLSLSQPLYRTPRREFSVSLLGDHRANQTYLLGVPYSFSPGAVSGRSVASVVGFSAQFTDRSPKHVFAARGSVNAGVNTLGATRNPTGPDGQFVLLAGQAQYVLKVGTTHNELVFRAGGQYSPDPLLAIEQLAIGGASSVRGYRENTMVRDMGIIASAEFHAPLWTDKEGRSKLEIVPFGDFGAGWDHVNTGQPFNDIGSLGVGLVFAPHPNVRASLFWGQPLRHITYPTHNLQDVGIHFLVTAWAF